MKEITIILPLHKWDNTYEEMFNNAINSLDKFYNDVKLIIVSPPSISTKFVNLTKNLDTRIVINTEKTDFCSQVNLGVKNCDTKWFSILEIDDEYKENWLKFMNKYINTYSDVDVFLPIVEDIKVDGTFLSYTNESVWAYGFSDVQGCLDNEALMDFANYQISGGLFKTELFKDEIFLKDNIKLTFGYELFLRLTHEDRKIMTIPRVLYKHMQFREDSLFWNYKNGDDKLSEKEVDFWLDSAKHEFFFKLKRDINYSE